ncbi:MAG: alkaline phosphatase family protein [Rhodospirillales bacterium]|nr:alkaline phosphatase family protein [Rhodospirillales bacterium]
MRRTLVLNVVGLSPGLVGAHTPNLARLAAGGGLRPLRTVLPALTCSAQSTFITGLLPRDHGIVGNGWYFRDLAEVLFWRQSNALVAGEKIWEAGRRRDPSFTCAKLFWWYNMYAGVDIAVTPRPMYPADGRKIPDVHTYPARLRDDLTARLGRFPLFRFWGPLADITSSDWIARCAAYVFAEYAPTLTLVYLPHLDYDLQRFGPDEPRIAPALGAIDALCGALIDQATAAGAAVLVLSEYGMTPVTSAVLPNRALRRAGLLAVREELGRELLDAGASAAFAVCDHQVAHVYVRRREDVPAVASLIAGLDGVESVLDGEGKRAVGLDHPRSGELVAISRGDRWFAYPYWLDDARAPDFATTVDIHRKPGYDPVELFLDPKLRAPKLAVGWRLAKKAVGLRTLMDVIPLTPELVRGSHGRLTERDEDGPLVISSEPELLPDGAIAATAVKDLMLTHVFAGSCP